MNEQVEKIKEELKRRIKLFSGLSSETINPIRIDEDEQILEFINSMGK